MKFMFKGNFSCTTVSEEPLKPDPELNSESTSMSSIQEDVKEGETEDEEGLTVYPYERVTTTSDDPAPDVDVTKREVRQKTSPRKYPQSLLGEQVI